MPLTAQEQLYPLSAQNSQTIPLDIIRPLGVMAVEYISFATFTLPDTVKVATFYSTSACFVTFGAAAAGAVPNATYVADALYVPAYCGVVAAVPAATCKIVPLGQPGKLIVQAFHPWASVALPREINKKI